MASDFDADAMGECHEIYGELDGCLKNGVRIPANYGDLKVLGFDPLKDQSVGVEPDRVSTNLLKGIPIVSDGWKRSKSVYSETAERWNEEGVGYDYMPSLIFGQDYI